MSVTSPVQPATQECIVCMERKANVRFRPCGHEMCDVCIKDYQRNNESGSSVVRKGSSATSCHFCRGDIEETIAIGPPSQVLEEIVEIDASLVQALAEQHEAQVALMRARARQADENSSMGPKAEAGADGGATRQTRAPLPPGLPGTASAAPSSSHHSAMSTKAAADSSRENSHATVGPSHQWAVAPQLQQGVWAPPSGSPAAASQAPSWRRAEDGQLPPAPSSSTSAAGSCWPNEGCPPWSNIRPSSSQKAAADGDDFEKDDSVHPNPDLDSDPNPVTPTQVTTLRRMARFGRS